jgi:hypothetical protein
VCRSSACPAAYNPPQELGEHIELQELLAELRPAFGTIAIRGSDADDTPDEGINGRSHESMRTGPCEFDRRKQAILPAIERRPAGGTGGPSG